MNKDILSEGNLRSTFRSIGSTDNSGVVVRSLEGLNELFSIFRLADDDHTKTAVESTDHFSLYTIESVELFHTRNITSSLEPLEDKRNVPLGRRELHIDAFREDTRNVLNETTSSDVGHTVDLSSPTTLVCPRRGILDSRNDGLDVDLGRGDEGLTEGLRRIEREGIRVGETRALDDSTDEGEAVGLDIEGEGTGRYVNTRGGQADDAQVRDNDLRKDVLLGDGTDSETSEIVLTIGVHVGHFSLRPLLAERTAYGFTTNESAVGLLATITDTLDDHRSNADIQSSGSKVVQEEERLSALGDNIVDGHSNEIDTDGVVLVHGEGELGSEKDPAGHTFNLVPTPSSPETRRVSAAW